MYHPNFYRRLWEVDQFLCIVYALLKLQTSGPLYNELLTNSVALVRERTIPTIEELLE